MAADARPNNRRYVRAVGPFNGYHVGVLRTLVNIFNLNVGGAFVSFPNEQPRATTFTLTIALAQEGDVTVLCQTVHRESNGIGVRFVDLGADDAARVARAVERTRAQQADSTPIVKLDDASVVYIFERKGEVLQIEARYSNSAQAFQIIRRFADGTTTHEDFTTESSFRVRLDELRSALEKDAWQTAGPTLLTGA